MSKPNYGELNDQLCEFIFPKENAFRPSYIELDDSENLELAEYLQCKESEIKSVIADYVRDHIKQSGTDHDPFAGIYRNLVKWKKEGSKQNLNYPEIPLLLVLTFAAVDMGGEGDHDPNAYYPRLREILKLDAHVELADSYRNYSTAIWGNLNYWLDTVHKGNFGIGTAYTIGSHRHVGFPLSQALIRSSDRKKLPRLFRRHGFNAFAHMVEHDMESIIEEWVTTDDQAFGSYRNPSRPFKRLWEQNDARERMCAIVCRELESWDGSVPRVLREDGELIEDDELLIRLEATKASFPSLKMNISFAISGFTVGEKRSIDVFDSMNAPHAIALSIDPAGWMRPNVGNLPISGQDLLEKGLTVQYSPNLKTTRPPKKVVVLRLDDLTRRYRETDRIELGVRSYVLVQDFKELVDTVKQILRTCARDDWKEHTSTDLPGLPSGWNLFSDVELLQPPTPELVMNANLESLKPIRSGSLTFSSGFQLPGRTQKWHGAIGLEIRATVFGSTKLAVLISRYSDGEEIGNTRTEYSQQTIIHKISQGELEDGDYKVAIFVDDIAEPISSRWLYVRSSDYPDQETWKNSERLVYDLGKSPVAVLNASALDSEDYFHIDGAMPVFNEDDELNLSTRVPLTSEWWGNRTAIIDSKVKSFQLSEMASFPCFEKGNHKFLLPPAESNKYGTGFKKVEGGKITGTCEYCGLTKRSPADHWVATRMWERAMEKKSPASIEIKIPRVDINNLPSVGVQEITSDHAFDALMHLGGGSDGYISSVASNVDPSALFRHEFVRTLEQLAHIDVSRDSEYHIKSWEVNPSIIVKTLNDYFLTGYWPTQYWDGLRATLGADKVFDVPEENYVSRMTISGVSSSELESCLEELEIEAPIVEKPQVDFLRMLPDIRKTAESLPSVNPGIFDEVCVYSPEQNEWIPVPETKPNKIGGYRVTSAYRNQYVVITSEDIDSGRMRFVSSEFAKYYCSAVTLKRPLFSFRSEESMLVVPKGAPVPGMYGRAAVMASGYLPKSDKTGRYLIYGNMTIDFVELLAARLGGQ